MINKYKELHEKLMDAFIEYHNIHTSWILKQTQEKTIALRRVLSEMRRIQTDMREIAIILQREESQRKRDKWKQIKETQK